MYWVFMVLRAAGAFCSLAWSGILGVCRRASGVRMQVHVAHAHADDAAPVALSQHY
jgi:hypothetical protein